MRLLQVLISSPSICKINYANSESECRLAQYCVTQAGELQLNELLVDETPRVLAYAVLRETPDHNAYICGPCNGIFYMYNYRSPVTSDNELRALWNPTTNELKPLPPITTNLIQLPSNISYSLYDIVYGFGFDQTTEDYKVIVIKGYWNETHCDKENRYPLSAFVHSLKTDSWRYLSVLTRYYDLKGNICYICVKGVFYWLGSYEPYGDSQVIISFDFATYVFEEIKLPDYDKLASTSLVVLHDSIAFLTVYKHFLHIWTLNEQGCWIKKSAVGPILELRNPVGHWNNNQVVLEFNNNELVVCDPSTQEIKDLEFMGEKSCIGFFAYKESLVSFKDGIGWLQYEEAKILANSRKLKTVTYCMGMFKAEWYGYE